MTIIHLNTWKITRLNQMPFCQHTEKLKNSRGDFFLFSACRPALGFSCKSVRSVAFRAEGKMINSHLVLEIHQ